MNAARLAHRCDNTFFRAPMLTRNPLSVSQSNLARAQLMIRAKKSDCYSHTESFFVGRISSPRDLETIGENSRKSSTQYALTDAVGVFMTILRFFVSGGSA